MTDGLTDEDRIKAWNANWHPSFDGIAIVDKDFNFRSVNPRFCEIVGVSPADILSHNFKDITDSSSREIDARNAKMVIKGKIDYYLLRKTYEFGNGHKSDVILLVTRVPPTREGDFKFFLSRIMVDEGKPVKFLDHSKDPVPKKFSIKAIGLVAMAAIGALAGGLIKVLTLF